MNRQQRGKFGENAAVDYLQEKGYRILARNFRFDRGEVDIIADDAGTLVFLEVKARRSKDFVEPEEAVTAYKRRQLQKVAEGYLLENNIEDRQCRFDVIAVSWHKGEAVVKHIRNVF